MNTTATLYDIIQSELIKKGDNELMKNDQLVFFDDSFSFMKKIMRYDQDVSDIVDQFFFLGTSLKDTDHDKHFKRTFLNRFLTREINRQTIEAFALQVMYTFSIQEDYINRLYTDLDLYLSNKQVNKQKQDGSNVSDNRQAFAQLPQNNVQIDVDNTIMESASDNTISRNKQVNQNQSDGETTSYRLDDLLKTNGLMEDIFKKFDKNCFLQVW